MARCGVLSWSSAKSLKTVPPRLKSSSVVRTGLNPSGSRQFDPSHKTPTAVRAALECDLGHEPSRV
jgi:hypothetical protein